MVLPVARRLDPRHAAALPWTSMITAAPVDDAYLVTSGLLAGAYPGHPDPAICADRLRRLSSAGVDAFVDLTEPGECEPYAHLLDGVRHERRPIADFGITTPDGYRAILDLVDGARDAGEGVYLHCFGGLGRTGTVVGCWLVRHGLGGGDPIARLAELRSGTADAWAASPQTEEQRRVVRGWRRGD
jgi:hypothetical protein